MKNKIAKLLSFVGVSGKELEEVIEIPKNSEMGDYALPCFFLAGRMKKNPVQIANEIAGKLKTGKDFEKIIAVGPYVNFFVNRLGLTDKILNDILKQRDNYGKLKGDKGKTMIEFSQANTHKAFHVGHIRGTSLGESLARIMEFLGKKVIRANYEG